MEQHRSGMMGSAGPVNGWGGSERPVMRTSSGGTPWARSSTTSVASQFSPKQRQGDERLDRAAARHSMPVQLPPGGPHSPARRGSPGSPARRGSPGSPTHERDQAAGDRFGPRVTGVDMDTIRRECNQRRALYEDPDFPATDAALYYSRLPPYKFVWRRPPEVALQYGLSAEMFVDSPGHFTVRQGELGDCWVVSALAVLSEQTSLLYRIVPRTQSFTTPWYVGAFEFYFWRHGKWEHVVIDDRLPTINGQLCFVHSSAPNEFWSALLEKAYAKLQGSYEALKSGVAADALHDLSGGIVETFPLDVNLPLPDHFVNTLFQGLERRSLISSDTHEVTDHETDGLMSNGLMNNHTYTITDLREIRLISEHGEIPVTLIRLRSAWGRTINWSGPWSERSVEWQSITSYDRQVMGLVVRDKAEFWMDLQDFVKSFATLTVCSLPPECRPELPPLWFVAMHHGRWKNGVTAGGRPVSRETHWTNPQYCLHLTIPDMDNSNLCSFIVEMEQKDRRRIKHRAAKHVDIGFVIYKCEKEYGLPLPRQYFDQHTFVDRCNYYSNTRQVCKRFTMEAGDYVIMPTTYEPNTEADFLLRVFSERDNKVEYVDDHADIVEGSPTPSDPELQERQATFREYFYSVAGENMEIDAFEFRQVLNMGLQNDPHHKDVSIDACKTMLTLVDFENTGMLGYHQFLYLWNCICSWKRTFYQYDRRSSGEIDAFILRSVLASLGYRLNSSVITKLVFRFANERYQIPFDDFILCMAKLLTLLHVFKSHQKNGTAAFTLDEWLEETLVI